VHCYLQGYIEIHARESLPMTALVIQVGLFLTDSAFALEQCQFFVDNQPYSGAPQCGELGAVQVVCPSSQISNGEYDLVKYTLSLNSHDAVAEKRYISSPDLHGLAPDQNTALWISNPDDQQSDFTFTDHPVSMLDLCDIPRKRKLKSLDIQVHATAHHQTGIREETEWNVDEQRWIRSHIPLYDAGLSFAEGTMAITQLPPFTRIVDDAGVIEVGFVAPEQMDGTSLPNVYSSVSEPGVQVTADIHVDGVFKGNLAMHAYYITDEHFESIFSDAAPSNMAPYDFIKRDIELMFRPDYDSGDRPIHPTIKTWHFYWDTSIHHYAFQDTKKQVLSPPALSALKEAGRLASKLPSLSVKNIDKTKIKIAKQLEKVHAERATMGVQHTDWAVEQLAEISWDHWRMEQLDGSFPYLEEPGDVREAHFEPMILHAYLARIDNRTLMFWGLIQRSLVEEGPLVVLECERMIASTAERIRLLK
jgi:hypothetical protein